MQTTCCCKLERHESNRKQQKSKTVQYTSHTTNTISFEIVQNTKKTHNNIIISERIVQQITLIMINMRCLINEHLKISALCAIGHVHFILVASLFIFVDVFEKRKKFVHKMPLIGISFWCLCCALDTLCVTCFYRVVSFLLWLHFFFLLIHLPLCALRTKVRTVCESVQEHSRQFKSNSFFRSFLTLFLDHLQMVWLQQHEILFFFAYSYFSSVVTFFSLVFPLVGNIVVENCLFYGDFFSISCIFFIVFWSVFLK